MTEFEAARMQRQMQTLLNELTTKLFRAIDHGTPLAIKAMALNADEKSSNGVIVKCESGYIYTIAIGGPAVAASGVEGNNVIHLNHYAMLLEAFVKEVVGVPPVPQALIELMGEFGELCNQIKKVYRDDGGGLTEDRQKSIKDELGDCFWCLFRLCNVLGFTPSDVCTDNLRKLTERANDSARGKSTGTSKIQLAN